MFWRSRARAGVGRVSALSFRWWSARSRARARPRMQPTVRPELAARVPPRGRVARAPRALIPAARAVPRAGTAESGDRTRAWTREDLAVQIRAAASEQGVRKGRLAIRHRDAGPAPAPAIQAPASGPAPRTVTAVPVSIPNVSAARRKCLSSIRAAPAIPREQDAPMLSKPVVASGTPAAPAPAATASRVGQTMEA
jgi:hypothetical protein